MGFAPLYPSYNSERAAHPRRTAAKRDADLAQALQLLLVAAVSGVGGLGGGDQGLRAAGAQDQGDDSRVPIDTPLEFFERRLPAAGMKRTIQNLDDAARIVAEKGAKLAVGEALRTQHV